MLWGFQVERSLLTSWSKVTWNFKPQWQSSVSCCSVCGLLFWCLCSGKGPINMANFLEQRALPPGSSGQLLSHTRLQKSARVSVTAGRFSSTIVNLINSSACGMEQAHSCCVRNILCSNCVHSSQSLDGLWCQFSTSITLDVEQYHIHTPENTWALASQTRPCCVSLMKCGLLPMRRRKNVPCSLLCECRGGGRVSIH